jgi:hypothetical protein
VVEVEPWVLHTGAGAVVGGEPTTAANTGTDAVAAEAGKWGHDGTSFGTSGEHYQMELSQPSSSLPPCGRGSHHLQ